MEVNAFIIFPLRVDRCFNSRLLYTSKLHVYALQNVKDQMEVMKEKDALINTRNKNHQLLLEELDNLVVGGSHRLVNANTMWWRVAVID